MFFKQIWQAVAALACAWVAAAAVGCAHGEAASQQHASTAAIVVPSEVPVANEAVPELIEIRVLLVAYQAALGAGPEQTRTRPQALERARMIAGLARAGDRLGELVLSYGDHCGVADERGVLQLHPAKPEAFGDAAVKAALALAVGRISEPVEVPQGYLVIERLADPSAGPTRVSAKHILIAYAGSPHPIAGATRSEAQARALAEQIVKEARQPNADWNELARRYTEEPGGKERAGDLGSFGRGQMVQAFEHAAFALKVGEISNVVQSPFGFHVIQRYQ